jgi:D-2-hydroxyacid dehydrogenase (NADP+)
MTTAVIFHDMPIADSIRKRTTDLTIIEADTEDETRATLGSADIFVTNPTKWSNGFLDYLSDGSWMQATSVGYAAFPVSEFRERGIALTNAATVHDSVVSEHAFALALALSRNLGPLFDQQRAHQWDRGIGSTQWDWKGRQLTVFGLGSIGEAVARRGRAFGLNVYGVKRTPSTYSGALSRDRVVSTDRFHDLLPETDLLVLTVPLTDSTYHVIDEEVMESLPDSAVLVNVARGSVVDQDALLTALRNGKLGGAGLDVVETEPLSSDSPLWDRDDVIVTPHVGGRSKDFPDRFGRLFVDNYDRWRTGQPLVNRIA